MGRKIATVLVVLLIVYGATVGALAYAMRQPPDQFGRFMSHFPMPTMMILPFRALWMSARSGHLNVGDAAPDFNLQTLDHKQQIQLSQFRGKQPVVLVFGSYT